MIVTEKADGSCVAVANIGGDVMPLIRPGYRAEDSEYEHLRLFACVALLYFASSAFDAWLKYSAEQHRIEARQATERALAEHLRRLSTLDDAILARLERILQRREEADRRPKAGEPAAD